MYKLVILIHPQEDWGHFEDGWPVFLAKAEKMPGLLKEATSPVDSLIHGHLHVSMIHELYFDSMDALKVALNSPEGIETANVLNRLTKGNVTLLMADHLEDNIENISAYTAKTADDAPSSDT